MPTKPPALFRVVEGIRRGETIPLTCRIGETWTMGRALDNSICLTDAEISRRHATVTFDGARFTLEDHRSTNGTFVNGAFTPKTALRDGDEVRLGEAILRFEESGGRTEPTVVASDSVCVITEEGMPGATPNVSLAVSITDDELRPPAPDRQSLEQLQSAHEQLAVLHEVNQAVAAALDRDALLNRVMEQLARLKDFDRGFILLYDGEGALQVAAHAVRPGSGAESGAGVISRTVLDRVIDDRVAVLCSDLQNDPRFGGADSVRLSSVRSAICAPIIAGAEVLGVLHLDSEALQNAFGEHDLRLFSMIANDLAIALVNQRMRDRLAERQRIEHELQIAHQIQQNFLPTHVPINPKIQLYARNVPALEVGGDFYDYFNLGDARFAVVIGDVSGKGVPAAMLMVKAMTEFRSLALDCRDSTATAVAQLNAALAQTTMRGMFLTLAYLLIDTRAMTLQYTSAGHLPPVRITGGDAAEPLMAARGIPIGITPDAAFEEARVTIQPGDRFFLTTDGVTEARNGAREEMTAERVYAVAAEHGTTPEALVEAVVEATLAFVGGAPQHDDLTAVAVAVG